MTTTSTPATAPLNIDTPRGAVHLGEWELSDDDRIAHRYFDCREHTTPGGLRVKVHGMQYVDGSLDGLSIAISDGAEDVALNAEDVEPLAAHLGAAAGQLE